MIATVEDKVTPLPRHARPRLSVVLLSRRSPNELENALLALRDQAFAFGAQVVIVRELGAEADDARVTRLAQVYKCTLAFAEPDSGRSRLSDTAMKHVTGDIVTFRDDAFVRDEHCLSPFERTMSVGRSHGYAERQRLGSVADERTRVVSDTAKGVSPTPRMRPVAGRRSAG